MFELIYGHAIDVRNFHKKIAMMDYVVPLEERQQGVLIVRRVTTNLTEDI